MTRAGRAIEDLSGTRISHFRLIDIIGSGGMGVVYRAEDENLQRSVAIKLLRGKPFAEAEARARFIDEARAAAAVSHVNVAAIYEVGEDAGRVYIAMELVEGQSLLSRLVAGPELDEALRLALQIAQGMARAHDKGVLHRDLKPDNVMVDAEGRVRILDFGLSKRVVPLDADDDGTMRHTRVGQVIGTPGYMSPEQALGLEVDHRSDIYSFGVILYELATCTQLFAGETPDEVTEAMIMDPEPPSQRNPRVGPELERIILRCLARRPADRFESAQEICAALERLGVHGRLTPSPVTQMPTGTVTLLQVELADPDKLAELPADRAALIAARHRKLVARAVGARGGYLVDGPTVSGDRPLGARGHLAAFPSARDAVLAAIALEAAHRDERWPFDIAVAVRVGLHTGEPRLVKGRYVGLDVHRATRIAAAASAGQVLLSASTWEQVKQADLDGATGHDIGTHRLEELRYPEHLFALAIAGVSSGEALIAAHRPSNLPAQATAFVGRERQLGEVCELVRRADVRLVTLTGPGGTGKTRLSIEVARALADDFPAGVYQVPLAPVSDPALVPALIAETVGVPERPGQPALEAIKAAIGGSSMLLVLDNFEQIIAAAVAVAELLAACPSLKIVATSREPLKLRFEREYPVPPLELPGPNELELLACESARLFVDRIRDVRPEFAVTAETAPHIAAICTRLEGLPLAIELAASRMKMLTLPALRERLRDRLGFLRGDARDREARHQTLRATIGWSYQLLDEADRILFRRVAVFAGGFDIETAESVCVLPSDGAPLDVFDRLVSLSDKSLLLRGEVEGEPRLDILQTIREYALDELRATPEAETLRARHAEHFVALADALGPSLMGVEQRRSTGQLLTEAQNIRAALAWAVEQPAPAHTIRLLRALLWYWLMHGHFTEAREWTTRALAQTSSAGPTRERAQLLEAAALTGFISGDFASAMAHAEEGVAIWRAHGDAGGAAQTQIVLGLTGFATGKIPDGPRLVEEALAACRARGDDFGTAFALLVLAELARGGGRFAEARSGYEEAIRLFRQTGNIVFPSLLAVNLVHCHLHEGDWRAAAALLAETLEMGVSFNYPLHISYYLASMACVAVARDRPLDGVRLFGAFEALNASLGAEVQPQDQAEFDSYIAAARRALGDAVVAAEWKRGAGWTREQAIAATLALRD